ncbi:MAG: ABC transporter substrate-binding protein [Clostridiales Family XIII bacterium]|nr:ABC transporter substrate-binding protein [Clostridiales Family XIII bacterium]
MKNIIFRSGISIVLAAVLSAGMTACGDSGADRSDADAGSDPAASEEPFVITLPSIGTSATNLDNIAIGIHKGFFEEENIQIKDAGEIAIPEFVPALLSGTITGATLMTSNGLAAIDNGGPIIQVGTMSETVEENPHMNFIVMKDSPIEGGGDLQGKKIGIGGLSGCTAGFPLEYAKQGGIEDPNDDVTFVTTPEISLVSALEKGEIDVVGLHSSPEQIAFLYPETRILFSDYDIFEDRGGDIGYYFPIEYAEENPEAISHFLAAVAKTQKWINENREEALKIYLEEINPNANADLLRIPHFSDDAVIKQDHTELWIDILGAGDSIQPLENEWTFDQVATNKYNPNYKE